MDMGAAVCVIGIGNGLHTVLAIIIPIIVFYLPSWYAESIYSLSLVVSWRAQSREVERPYCP